MIEGYFLYRSTMKGGVTSEKNLAINHISAMNNPDKTTVQIYQANLLAVFPLDEQDWGKSLAELEAKFPCRGGDGTQRSNEGKPKAEVSVR